MVTRFQQAIREGSVDITGFPGQPKVPTGFKIVAQPRPGFFSTRAQLNKAIERARQTGVFKFSEFIGTFRVSNVGAFDPQAERTRVLALQRLAPATIRALEKQRVIAPRFETRAGIAVVKKPETLAQRSSRLAQKRRTALIRINRTTNLRQQRAVVQGVGGFSSITGATQLVTPGGRVIATTSKTPNFFRNELIQAFRFARKTDRLPPQPTRFLESEAKILDLQLRTLEAKNRAIEARAKELDRLSKVANISTQTLVAFNNQVIAQEKRVKSFNARVVSFNAKLPKKERAKFVIPSEALRIDTKFDKFSKSFQQGIFKTATDIQEGLRVGGSRFVNIAIKGKDFIIGRLTTQQQTIINKAFLKSPDLKLRALAPFLFTGVTLRGTNKEKFNRVLKDLGGAVAQTGAVFIPGGIGAVAIGSAIIANNKPIDTATNIGIGLLFGVGSVFLGKGSRLVRLFLGKGRAGKVYVVAEKTATRGLIPLYFTIEGTRAGARIVEASISGERQRLKDISTQTASAFGAFRVGARIGTGFTERVLTPIEGRATLASAVLKLPKTKQTQFKKYFEIAQEFAKLKTNPVNPKTAFAERISLKAGGIIDNFIQRKPNLVLGGSLSQAFQVPLRVRLRLPKPSDLDLYGRGRTWITNARELFILLKKAGIPRVSLLVKGARAEITIAGKKAIEFHSIDKLIQNIREVRPLFDISGRGIIRTPNGTRMLKLSVSAKRKIVGRFTDNRLKDIVQFEALMKALRPEQIREAKARAEARGVLRVSFSGLLPRINLKLSSLLKLIPRTTRLRIRSLLSQLRKAVGNKALRIAGKLKTILRTSLRFVTRKINTRIKLFRNRLKRATIKTRTIIQKRINQEIGLLGKLNQDQAGYLSLLTIGKRKVKIKRIKKKVKKIKPLKRKVPVRFKPSRKKVRLKQTKQYNHYFKRRRPIRGRVVYSYRRLKPNRKQMASIAFYNNLSPAKRRSLPGRITIEGISYPKTEIVRTRLVFAPNQLYSTNLIPRYPLIKSPTQTPSGYATIPPRRGTGYPPSRTTTRTTPPPDKLLILPRLPFEKQVRFLQASKKPFNVFVRTKIGGKAKFRRVNKKPLTGSSALALGQKITDNDPRRSFFVGKGKGKPVKLKIERFDSRRYRKPIGKTRLPLFAFVEKSKFAISSKGELRGITAKGIRAIRLKKRLKRRPVKRFKRRLVKKVKGNPRRFKKRIKRKKIRRKRIKRKPSIFTL